MRAYLFWIFLFSTLPSIWRAPFWGIILYSALNIVRPEMFFWGGRTGAKALLIIYVFTLISVVANYGKSTAKSFLTRETVLILWLYFAVIISIELSGYEISRAYYYANELGKLFVFCSLMVLAVDSKEKVLRYEIIMLACFVFLGLWGIDQHFRGNERLEGLGGLAFPDTNGVAAIFVLFFPVSANFLLNGKNKKIKGAAIVAALTMIVLVVFTQSRGGFLGLSVAIIIMTIRSRQRIKIFIYSFVFLLVLSPFISNEYLARLGTIAPSESQQLDGSANSRLYLWQAGMMIFADNMLLGTGFMSYPVAKMPYEDRFSQLDQEFRSYVFRENNKKVTHNTYIQMLSDCGIVGFTPFALFLFGTFWQNFNLRQKLKNRAYDTDLLNLLNALEAGIWGYSVCIFFIDSITMVLMPWQIVISAIIRRLLIEKAKTAPNQQIKFSRRKALQVS